MTMRSLNKISGTAIMFFLVMAIDYYEGDMQRLFLFIGALTISVYLVIFEFTKLKSKKKGYILRA